GYEVDHINNNKTDNRLTNLQLLTPSENSRKNRRTKLTCQQAEEIRARFAEGAITKTALAKHYGCGKTTIARIIKKETYLRQTPAEQTQNQTQKQEQNP
ncbi:MAG: HNH endonuclease, partial [Methanocorpusculum sp.]|nr:HNH endonuclease [Methanocorpusculum sp.]